MDIKVFRTCEEASAYAADLVEAVIRKRPDCVLGLATGSTPEGLYAELVRRHQTDSLDFSQVKSINLDEYIGLTGDHNQSYRYFMDSHLMNHVNIDRANTFVPNGTAVDLEAECRAYDQKWLDLGGTDIQVLGIGPNGHIGFNEPGEILHADTHIEVLTQETIDANARFFASADEVPRRAITMGMRDIMSAQQLIVLAFGAGKAEAIARFNDDQVTPDCPVTFIKLHPNATLIVDEAAAALLK